MNIGSVVTQNIANRNFLIFIWTATYDIFFVLLVILDNNIRFNIVYIFSGTRTMGFYEGVDIEPQSSFLLALKEKVSYGLCVYW